MPEFKLHARSIRLMCMARRHDAGIRTVDYAERMAWGRELVTLTDFQSDFANILSEILIHPDLGDPHSLAGALALDKNKNEYICTESGDWLREYVNDDSEFGPIAEIKLHQGAWLIVHRDKTGFHRGDCYARVETAPLKYQIHRDSIGTVHQWTIERESRAS